MKIIQIVVRKGYLLALTEDGKIYEYDDAKDKWVFLARSPHEHIF